MREYKLDESGRATLELFSDDAVVLTVSYPHLGHRRVFELGELEIAAECRGGEFQAYLDELGLNGHAMLDDMRAAIAPRGIVESAMAVLESRLTGNIAAIVVGYAVSTDEERILEWLGRDPATGRQRTLPIAHMVPLHSKYVGNVLWITFATQDDWHLFHSFRIDEVIKIARGGWDWRGDDSYLRSNWHILREELANSLERL